MSFQFLYHFDEMPTKVLLVRSQFLFSSKKHMDVFLMAQEPLIFVICQGVFPPPHEVRAFHRFLPSRQHVSICYSPSHTQVLLLWYQVYIPT